MTGIGQERRSANASIEQTPRERRGHAVNACCRWWTKVPATRRTVHSGIGTASELRHRSDRCSSVGWPWQRAP